MTAPCCRATRCRQSPSPDKDQKTWYALT